MQEKTKVEYLRVIISQNSVKMNPVNTAGTGWCFPQKNPFLDMFCDF